MAQLKLCYFDARGLAETSRLLLAAAKVDYIDFRYPLEVIDWKTYKFKRDEFDTAKSNGKLVHSLNKVPYLEIDNLVICQSKSIERYIARKYGLMGTTEEQSAIVDSICECIRDFKTDYQSVRKLPIDEKEAGLKKWFEETLPTKLSDLNKIIGYGNCVGSVLTLADISLYAFITDFFDNKEGALKAIEETENIKSIVNNVSKLQEIQDWLKKRPLTSF